MPKTKFTKEIILSTAIQIATSEGIDGITIRKIADMIGSSVAPIYTTYKKRDELMKDVYEYVSQKILSFTDERYTDNEFLNIGIGILQFAKSNPDLFKNYFLSSESNNIYILIEKRYLNQLKRNKALKSFTDEQIKNLLYKNWIVGLGLALTLINSDQKELETYKSYMYEIGGDIIFSMKNIHEHEECRNI